MFKYNIYIGLFDKVTKQQELSDIEYKDIIREVMRDKFINNYTLLKGTGYYSSASMQVKEPCIIVEIIEHENWINPGYVSDLKELLCDRLNQESVLITKQDIQVI